MSAVERAKIVLTDSAQRAGLPVQPWLGPPLADRPLGDIDARFAGSPVGAMRLEDAARLLGWIP
jgi:hypothetical protein